MPHWKDNKRRNRIVILFLGCIGVYAGRIVMPNCSAAISAELGFNKEQIGLILAIFFWGYMSTQYIGGYLSDRIGGEIVISVATMFWAAFTLVFVWIPDFSTDKDRIYGWFLLFRYLFGASQGFFFPSVISLLASRVDLSLRQSTYAYIVSGNHLGTLICGSLGSYLLEVYGWRLPFHIIGCVWFVWGLIFYLNSDSDAPNCSDKSCLTRNSSSIGHVFTVNYDPAKPKLEAVHLEKQVRLQLEENNVTEADNHDKVPRYKSLNWGVLLRSSVFWSIVTANFAHSNTFFILFNWLPTYFHDNFKDARSWVFNVVPWVIIFPSVLFSGFLGDILVKKKYPLIFVRKMMNTIVLLISSVFLFALSFSDDYVISLTLVSLAIAACGFHTCGVILSPQDIAPNHGGQVYGVVSTIGSLPGFLGVYLAGFILEHTHKWSHVFNMTIGLNLVGWLAFTFYGKADQIV